MSSVRLFDVRPEEPLMVGEITISGGNLTFEGESWIGEVIKWPAGALDLVEPAASLEYLRALEIQFSGSAIRAEFLD